MGKFEDYIRSIDTATPLPEGLLTNLQNAYAEDLGLSEAKIASVESVLADKEAQVTELSKELTSAKSHNYDLLMKIPHTVDETNPPGSVEETVTTIDSLFGEDNGT